MAKSSGVLEEASFHIEQEVRIAAPRPKVFRSLCDVQSWWCHHFAQASPRMTLDPRVGGAFREHWGPEGADEGALWGTVTFIKSPEVLRLAGPLGMHTPVTSVYEFRLEDEGSNTLLRLSHRCIGVLDANWKASHEKGWGELWESLRAFVERGERHAG